MIKKRSVLPYKLKQKLLRYAKKQYEVFYLGSDILVDLEVVCKVLGVDVGVLMATDYTKDGRTTEAFAYIVNGEGTPEENVEEIEKFLNSIKDN